jgi:hypothetical protein
MMVPDPDTYSRDTAGIQQGYSRDTAGIQQGYSRDTAGIPTQSSSSYALIFDCLAAFQPEVLQSFFFIAV